MKLYNKTKWPTPLFPRLLTLAGRSVGARTEKVVVKLTQNRYSVFCGGIATECSGVARWHLRGRGRHLKNHVETDGGYITLSLPKIWASPTSGPEALLLAEDIYKTAQHEFGHIRDFQNGGRWRLPWSDSRTGRRPPHRLRPEERRAKAYVEEAKDYREVQDLILAVGVWIEEQIQWIKQKEGSK